MGLWVQAVLVSLQEQLRLAYFTLLCSRSYMAQSSRSGGFNEHSVVTHTVPGAETRVQFTTGRGGRQTIPDTEMGTKNIEVPSCAWEQRGAERKATQGSDTGMSFKEGRQGGKVAKVGWLNL